MMAKWYTELLMMGLQRKQYIMLLDTCMTNYLLKRIKGDSEDYLTSENYILFQSFISTIKDDLLTHKKIFTLTQLLELFFLNFCPQIRRKFAHHTHKSRHAFGNCSWFEQCSPYMWWKSNFTCCRRHFEKANQRHYHLRLRIPCTWRGLNIKF